MKILVLLLIILSFLQGIILPVNLVLLVLICRAYLMRAKSTLYLAFFFGLLLSHLNLQPLGLTSLQFLLFVQVTQTLGRRPFAGHPFLIIPLSFVFTLVEGNVYLAMVSAIVSLPIFYFLRLWEERFAPPKEIKLRL